jgi:cation diffusion facilitator CzcD-associated flavoprotein CzcO
MSTAPVTNGVEHVDVLIVGAGISGIAAAHSLSTQHADKTFAILEARGASGGTWDLFRYPGIRSDSDLHTFSYEFKPWRNEKHRHRVSAHGESYSCIAPAHAEDRRRVRSHERHRLVPSTGCQSGEAAAISSATDWAGVDGMPNSLSLCPRTIASCLVASG